jgi:glutamate-1-semialdehyde 2,1-aminomutase
MQFEKSRALFEEACEVIPGGISSNVRQDWEPFPLFYERGQGSHVWDADGNEFIDYVLARGPLLYGHSPTRILEAMFDQYRRGIMFAGQHELEIRAAKKICDLVPCAEMVRFGQTGSDAVHAALRLARAHTGRTKILRFEGQYHGWFDSMSWSFAPPLDQAGPRENPVAVSGTLGQPLTDGEHLRMLPWNDLELVEKTFKREGHTIAAVISEPIMCNFGGIEPRPGFLQGLREITQRHGALFILDEVITGFRVAVGGCQELYGVTPDLATFAKALGGGVVVSALAGSKETMKLFGEKKTVHAGTYNANPPTLAAVMEALEMVSENGGSLLKQTHARCERLAEGIRGLARESGKPVAVRGRVPAIHVSFLRDTSVEAVDYRTAVGVTDGARTRQLFVELQERGVRVTPGGLWFMSTAHTDEDVDRTLDAVADTLKSI